MVMLRNRPAFVENGDRKSFFGIADYNKRNSSDVA
jgi:hypothetical protein